MQTIPDVVKFESKGFKIKSTFFISAEPLSSSLLNKAWNFLSELKNYIICFNWNKKSCIMMGDELGGLKKWKV